MLHFKFIGSQFKNIWIILLVFLGVFALVIGLCAIVPSFGDFVHAERNFEWDQIHGEWMDTGGGSGKSGGSASFANVLLFGVPFFVIFFAFGITLSMILINRDITRGYITSWLTSSMSRATIFNSKLFVVVTSTLLIDIWIILVEMVIFSLRMEDFSTVVKPLLVGNLSLIIYSFLAVAIPWIVFSIFKKPGLALGILIGLGSWFVLCQILITLSIDNASLEGLKYFKYFTLQSLVNSPLNFGDISSDHKFLPPPPPGDGDPLTVRLEWKATASILPLKAINYVWQLPVMLVSSIGFFTGAQFIIKNQNFAF